MPKKIKITIVVKGDQVKAIYSNQPEQLKLKVVDMDNLKPGDIIPETAIIKFGTKKKRQ